MRTASLPRSCLLALVAGLLPGVPACTSTPPSAAAPTPTPAKSASSASSSASKAPTAKKPDSVELPPASRPFVTVSTVDDAAVTPWVRAAARVAFRERGVARVAPAIDGRIVEVHVRAGDVVRAGAPLMTLVSAAAATARADLERARVSLRLAEADAARQAEMLLRGVGIAAEKLAAD
ncbi:MAG TPA: efflux RND transporter periplasmic adaptor subunit, partial [Myxococcota bacterium]